MSEPLQEPQVPARTGERAGWLSTLETAGGGRLPDAWDPSGLASAYQVAALLARSQVVPYALVGKPEDIFVVLWTGKELGLSAMTALRHLPVIGGRCTMSAELMRARALGHPECRYFDVVEADSAHAVVEWQRGDRPPSRASFTMEDARRAGLLEPRGGKPSLYLKYPEEMLVARATSRGVRRGFPEVLGPASYTPEEAREALEMEQVGGRWEPGAPNAEAASRAAAAIVGRNRPAPLSGSGLRGDEPIPDEHIKGPDPVELQRQAQELEREQTGTGTALAGPAQPQDAPPPPPERGAAPAKGQPKPWQHVLDLKLPRVGDTIAQRLLAAGIDTLERIVEVGRYDIRAKIDGISDAGAQAIVAHAEKALGGEPPDAHAPIAADLTDVGPAVQAVVPGVAPPAEDPFPGMETVAPGAAAAQGGIPFPGQAPTTNRPTYIPPGGRPVMTPIGRAEIFALERAACGTKRSGAPAGKEGDDVAIACLRAFIQQTFGVPITQLPKGYYRAAFRWAESAGLDPQPEELVELRKKGLAK